MFRSQVMPKLARLNADPSPVPAAALDAAS
jgi:hypothetical protein